MELEGKKIAIYGLSTETERVLIDWNGKYTVIGLLDSFQKSGEQFGFPILDIQDIVKQDNLVIVVVARPGSCRAISKKIGDLCRENNVELWDVRGNDLLAEQKSVYDFKSLTGYTKQDLENAVADVSTVSIDLFDTLLVRNISSFEGLLELIATRLKEKGIDCPNLPSVRLMTEKRMSACGAPKLREIYSEIRNCIGAISMTAEELADFEFSIDKEILEPRTEVVSFINRLILQNKSVYITTDSYYSKEQILDILCKIGVSKVNGVLVSSEYNTGKCGKLFDELIKLVGSKNILHIGDDLVADIESAEKHGLVAFRLYSVSDLMEILGGLNISRHEHSLSDQLRIGMFAARMFNSPFQFEENERRIRIQDARDVGYILCAPMMLDFTEWFEKETTAVGNENIWFCSRDGYLIKKLFGILFPAKEATYVYISRISAIRAGMETISDIEYVDSMKYSGAIDECLKTRFGIDVYEIDRANVDSSASGLMKYTKLILEYSKRKKINNRKYLDKLQVKKGGISFFDFVAKGTCQMYLQKLVDNSMTGLYFLQLEPEYMKSKHLMIKSFYSKEEKETSGIFQDYYILETLLTSPETSVEEFDESGTPIFATESRTDQDIECILRAQDGILEYVKKYIEICPSGEKRINKKLDEEILSLIHHVEICDQDFLSLTVEDPFFHRMTDIKDVL